MTSPFPPFDSASGMPGQLQHTPLLRRPSRASAHQPACRPSRVEKSRSYHNSPKTMDRRKTTTEAKLYATLDDHYRMMFGLEPEDEEEAPEQRPQYNRPVSWHPSSAQFQPSRSSQHFSSQQIWCQQQDYSDSPRHSMHGSDFYSLSNRNSTLDPMPTPATYTDYMTHRGSEESDAGWQNVTQPTPTYIHSSLNTPTTDGLPWYLQQWAQKHQAQAPGARIDRSTDFLPIQHPATQDEPMDEDDAGEKLVALGLYDQPESSLTWLEAGEATGKGLKLEETWQPPEEEEDDNDEEDGDEDDEDMSSDASEEPSPPLAAIDAGVPHMHLPVHVQTQTSGSLEGQSFFFDEDESVSKEWWFQQLKQPSMPVRDNGLGYGWL